MPKVILNSFDRNNPETYVFDTAANQVVTASAIGDAAEEAGTPLNQPAQEQQKWSWEDPGKASGQLDISYNFFSKRDPEQASIVASAADKLGMSSDLVLLANEELQKELLKEHQTQKEKPDWNELIKNSPQTAALLQDRATMAGSWDDIDPLSTVEEIGTTLANSYEYTEANRELARIGEKMMKEKKTLEDMSTEDRKRMMALQARMARLQERMPETWSLGGVVSALGGMAPQLIEGIKGAAVGWMTGVAAGSLVPGIGTVAGGAIASAGAVYAMANDYASQQQGLAYLQSLQQGTSRKEAGTGASVAYIGNALLSLPMAASGMGAPFLRMFGSNALGKIAEMTGVAAITGMGMKATDILANKISHGKANYWTMEDFSQIASGGIEQLPAAFAMGAPGLGVGMLRGLNRQAHATKTMARNPKVVKQLIEQVVEGTPAEKTQIDAVELVERLNQMDDTTAQKVVETLGTDVEELKAAVATGDKIEVNTADVSVLPEEVVDSMADIISIDSEPTIQEMQMATESNGKSIGYMQELENDPAYQSIAKEAEKEAAVDTDAKKQAREKALTMKKDIEENLDNEQLYKAEKDFKFNLQLFASKSLKDAAKKFQNGKLTEELMEDFDAFAQEHGFKNGSELAQRVLESRSRDEELAYRMSEAEQAELRRYGADEESAEVIGKLSETAMAKEQMETSALGKEVAQEIVGGKEGEAPAGRLGMTIAEAKEQARENLKVLPVQKARDYHRFFELARRAQGISDSYYAKGNKTKALEWKNRKMVAMEQGIMAVEANRRVISMENNLDRYANNGRKLFANQDALDQAGMIMQRFGFRVKNFNPNQVRETIWEYKQRMTDLVGNFAVEDWIAKGGDPMPYQQLTMEQLTQVNNAVKNIEKVSKSAQEMINDSSKKTVEEACNQVIREISEWSKPHYTLKQLKRGEKKIRRFIVNFLQDQEQISTAIENLAGTKSLLWQKFVRETYEAANKESIMVRKLGEQYKAIWSRYTPKERRLNANQKIYVSGLDDSFTKLEMICIALNLGNEGNMEKMFSPQGIPIIFRDSKNVNPINVMKMLEENLTSRDWETVQQIHDFMESIWPEVEQFQRDYTGFAPEKVEARAYTVRSADGEIIEMRGGYYPLVPDDLSAGLRMDDNEGQPVSYHNNYSWAQAMTRQGHTKLRSDAKYTVSIDPDIPLKHLADVVHDLYFRKLVNDQTRIMKHQGVREILETRGTDNLTHMFDDQIKQLSGNNYGDISAREVNKWLGLAKKAYGGTAIAMRLGVITQNIANIALYPGAVEGWGYSDTIKATVKYGLCDFWPKAFTSWRHERGFREQIYAESAFMADRAAKPDQSFRNTQRNVVSGDPAVTGVTTKIENASQWLMLATDDLFAIPQWMGAKEKALKMGMSNADAVYYADSLIMRTLGSGRRYDQSRVIRAPSSQTVSVLAQFQTFFNTELNRWMREVGMVQREGWDGVPRMATFMASRFLIVPLISNLLAGKFPDDDESWPNWFVANAITTNTANIVLLKDIAPGIVNTALDVNSYSYRAGGAFSFISQVATTGQTIGRAINAASNGTSKPHQNEKAVQAAVNMLTAFFGIPGQWNAWAWNAYDYAMNDMEPELGDIFTRRPQKERYNDSASDKKRGKLKN